MAGQAMEATLEGRPRSRLGQNLWPIPQSLRVLGAATVGLGLGYSNLVWQSFGLFVIPLSTAHGWSIGEISLGFTILALVVVFAAPLAGLALDRFGVRRVLLPSIVLLALAFASLGLVGDRLWQFYVTYALIALAGCGTLPGTYARAVIGWFDEKRGLALGIMLAGISVGGTLIPPFVQFMLERTDLRTTYFATASIIVLVALPVAALFLHEPPHSGPKIHHVKLPIRVLLRDARFLKLAAGFLLLGVYNSGVATHLVSIMVSRGVSNYAAALAMSLLAGGIALGRVAAGWMLDRFFAPRVIIAFTLAPIAGLILLASGATGGVALSCAVLLGIGLGAEIDFLSYLTSRYFPNRNYGQVANLIYSVHIAGAGLGPLMVAYSITNLGSYNPALIIIAVFVTISIPLFVTLGPYLKEAPDTGQASGAGSELMASHAKPTSGM